jgi:hypothetical protein
MIITLVINIVRIVAVLLLVRFVLRFVAAVIQGYTGGAERGRGGPAREVVATDMVRDRVCDTFVPRARALVAVVDGREQHFCSPECRERARVLASS